MRQRRRFMPALVTAAAGAALLAVSSPAWAGPSGNNPLGDNGTVKIDGTPFDDLVDNQPHVTCEFELEFFNFDQNQKADITLTGHPPSGDATKAIKTVKFWDDYTISNTPASGAQNDHDVVIKVSANDLDLAGLTAHPKQGYHLKLTVDLTDGNGKAKHKVFWMQPCAATTTPTSPNTPPNGGQTDEGQAGGEEENLPLTGAGVAGIAALGAGLIGGGAAVVIMRRRRDNITFTS